MKTRLVWLVPILVLVISACNLAVPEITPTVAPTFTPTQTLPSTPTPTLTQSPTQIQTASITASTTITPSNTPSATFTPSETPPPTSTLTPSNTLTPSDTPTGTPSDTLTPSETSSPTRTFTPSNTLTPSDTPTGTPSNTLTPSDTPSPTSTLTPSDTLTPSNTPTGTPTDTPTLVAQIAQVPSPTNTNTITPLSPAIQTTPTLEPLGFRTTTPLPPTIITAAPGTNPAPVTPITSGLTPELSTQTPLPPLPTATILAPTSLPTIAVIPNTVPENPQTRAFALSATGGAVSGSGFLLPFSANTFARNPVDPSRMAVVDSRGLLYMFFGGLQVDNGARIRVSPFVADFEPDSAASNQAKVTQIGWSPDGQHLAFLVDAEADDRDGVWIMNNTDQNGIRYATQVFRECPAPVENTCTVERSSGPFHYNSLRFEWNNSSNSLLIELNLTDENRRAFTVVGLNTDPTQLPPIYRYDYASWSWDGSRLLVSGARADGRITIGWITPGNPTEQVVFDGTNIGLWLQDAVERPDGQIVALGSTSGASSAMSLYDAAGNALSAPIGTSAPVRVNWSPDRSAVLVVESAGTAFHYYVAQVNGAVSEITASVAGALAVEWVNNAPPPSSDQAGSTPTVEQPTIAPVGQVGQVGGVGVQGNYGLQVNQQVQVIAPAGVNLRADPSINGQMLRRLNAFEYVLIIGGPVNAEGLVWWQVQAADGQIGWAAEGSGGVQYLSVKPL